MKLEQMISLISIVDPSAQIGFFLDKFTVIKGFSIDSRKVENNFIFCAFDGERVNGHDYIGEARKKGAICALVTEYVNDSLPQILVKDVYSVVINLARFYRNIWEDKKVIAISGSVGKTTIKDMVSDICTDNSKTYKTQGNNNNLLGLSLTILNVSADTRYVVLELGINAPNEMLMLADLAKPDIGLVGNINPCHLELLGSVEKIAKEKSFLYKFLPKDAVAVINKDEYFVDVFIEASNHCKQVYYSTKKIEKDIVFASNIAVDSRACIKFDLNFKGEKQNVILNLLGEHQVSNAVAAASCALSLGFNLGEIASSLKKIKQVPRRLELKKCRFTKASIIDDTYNCSPEALEKALSCVSKIKASVRYLILGDMAELGSSSEFWHRKMGEIANKNGVTVLYTIGEFASLAQDNFLYKVKSFDSIEDIVALLKRDLDEEMLVLVKGSRNMHLDRLCDQLCQDQEVVI